MSFKKLFPPVLFAVFFSQAIGVPSGALQEDSFGVHHRYNPDVLYETYGEGVAPPSGLAKGTTKESAVSFAMYKLGIDNDQVIHRSGFSSDITDHAYLSQVHNGIPFVNAVANVAMKDGKVVAFGSSFVKSDKIAPSQPSVDKKDAIATAEAALGCTHDSYPTSLQYLANPDGSASLVHVFQLKNDEAGKYYQAHVDAHSGKLLSTVNFVADATYTAVPITKNSILDGQSVLVNPQDPKASRAGWHSDRFGDHAFTSGNNGYAYREFDRRYARETSKATYAYRYNTRLEPDAGDNIDASIVNAFYVMGKVHDVTYRYGFTEEAYNFQTSNFNHGGQPYDGIIMSVNDRREYNNAFFTTPPDGRPGLCRLHLFNLTQPFRPSAMENSVVVHELGHGVSNRLVGGGTAACQISLEAQGLGEGWSDILADWMHQTSEYTKDFTLGTYVIPYPFRRYGFRDFPYSTDMNVNPRMYSDVGRFKEQHYIGEVWANTIHNVYAELVAAHGYARDAMTNPDGAGGNVIFMHLFIDSLALTPCYPTFISARNAFIQADINRYRGLNYCLLWDVFASRGLGYNARPYIDNRDVPSGCLTA